MMIKIFFLDLNGVTKFFFLSFSLNILISAGKEKDTWYYSPYKMGETLFRVIVQKLFTSLTMESLEILKSQFRL